MLKPVAVDTYNHSMNGIDYCSDQTYYSLVWKALKWWEMISFISLSVPPSTAKYILHQEACRQVGTKPLDALDFLHFIIQVLSHEPLQQYDRPSSDHPRLRPTPI